MASGYVWGFPEDQYWSRLFCSLVVLLFDHGRKATSQESKGVVACGREAEAFISGSCVISGGVC